MLNQTGRSWVSLGLLLLAGLFSSSSYAVGITPLIGWGMGNALVSGTAATYDASYHLPTLGGGVLFEFSVSRRLKVETGGIYMGRGFVESANKMPISFKTLQVPLVARVYLLTGISVSVGAYLSYGLGSILVETTPVAYNQLTYSNIDYGATASFSLRFGLARAVGLIAQVRGLYGIPNVSQTPGVNVTLFDIQTFAGVKFGE